MSGVSAFTQMRSRSEPSEVLYDALMRLTESSANGHFDCMSWRATRVDSFLRIASQNGSAVAIAV
jgi:hypothetical protein